MDSDLLNSLVIRTIAIRVPTAHYVLVKVMGLVSQPLCFDFLQGNLHVKPQPSSGINPIPQLNEQQPWPGGGLDFEDTFLHSTIFACVHTCHTHVHRDTQIPHRNMYMHAGIYKHSCTHTYSDICAHTSYMCTKARSGISTHQHMD